jgi:hypothetical protein
MHVRTGFLWAWVLMAGACSNSKNSSSPPLVPPTSRPAVASTPGSVSTAYEARVDTTPELQARMTAYHGPLQKFMHACLFKEQTTQAFSDALREAVSGSAGTCEDAVGKLEKQPIIRQELNNKGLTEISLLQEFTFLQELNLSGNSISDLSPLSELTQLTYLDISDNAVIDITPLQGMSSLTELNMINNKIENLDALHALSTLAILRMSNNYISNISSLQVMRGLIELDAAKNSIQNLGPLSNLTSLQRLYLDENHILYVDAIRNLSKLQELTLSQAITPSTPVPTSTDTDTDTVPPVPVARYKISSITPLSNLVQLQKLMLRNNNIEDASVVEKMPLLQTLDLSNNNMRVAKFLTASSDNSSCSCALRALKTLDLSGNRFTNLEMLRVCATNLKMNFIYSPQGGSAR